VCTPQHSTASTRERVVRLSRLHRIPPLERGLQRWPDVFRTFSATSPTLLDEAGTTASNAILSGAGRAQATASDRRAAGKRVRSTSSPALPYHPAIPFVARSHSTLEMGLHRDRRKRLSAPLRARHPGHSVRPHPIRLHQDIADSPWPRWARRHASAVQSATKLVEQRMREPPPTMWITSIFPFCPALPDSPIHGDTERQALEDRSRIFRICAARLCAGLPQCVGNLSWHVSRLGNASGRGRGEWARLPSHSGELLVAVLGAFQVQARGTPATAKDRQYSSTAGLSGGPTLVRPFNASDCSSITADPFQTHERPGAELDVAPMVGRPRPQPPPQAAAVSCRQWRKPGACGGSTIFPRAVPVRYGA